MWKMCFMTGLITLPVILAVSCDTQMKIGSNTMITLFDTNESTLARMNVLGWFIGGVLVGWGTKMGNGCTSGHGVCGLPRLSIRSFVATITFMLTGIIMATFRYHYPFLTTAAGFGQDYAQFWKWFPFTVMIGLNIACACLIIYYRKSAICKDLLFSHFTGMIFGLGLLISGMCRQSKIQGFLVVDPQVWDPTLMFVMMSAVAINLLTFRFILRKSKPWLSDKFILPNPQAKVDNRLIIGAAIFGMGWGLSAMCPGPALINLFVLTHSVFWMAGMVLGQLGFEKWWEWHENRQKMDQHTDKEDKMHITMMEQEEEEEEENKGLLKKNTFKQ